MVQFLAKLYGKAWHKNSLHASLKLLTKAYPVLANSMTELSIRLPSSRSTGRYCRDVFSGCPKKYSISSPCSTPIHSPHSDVLVRYKTEREREKEGDRERDRCWKRWVTGGKGETRASEIRDIVVNLARNYADKHPPFLFIYLISPRSLARALRNCKYCRSMSRGAKKKKKDKPKSEKREKRNETAKKRQEMNK